MYNRYIYLKNKEFKLSQKSILAKLLATENIHVQHGNYETAWFDIKNRVLGLPQWADKGKDVSDLLIGHEVGHALETPFEGWHDSPEKMEGCPRTYINVVEDARIERKIKSRYVGLVGPFQRGYAKLFAEGFFGSKFDFENMKLIDKINLKAKVGAHLSIPFNPEEDALYNATMTTDTFEDVLNVVRDILAYTKDNTPELITPPPPAQSPDMDMPGEEEGEDQGPQNTGHDDYDMPETEEQEQSESADSEETDDRKETNDSSSKSDDEETLSAEEESTESKPSHDEDVSDTDEAFRRKERDLLDFNDERQGDQPMVMNGFDRDTIKNIIVDKDRLFKAREKARETDYTYDEEWNEGKAYEDYREEFQQYYKKVQKDVGFAVKEFELKKAAYRWTRAETARSGSIDVSRLWAYKTDDDIFARVTRLADAKNHGLIGLIDYSGSMANVMGDVLDQLVHLAVFCKKVNIPFDFYGFTTNNKVLERRNQNEGDMESQGISMPNILSSSFNKADFEEAVYHCFVRKVRSTNNYWGYGERSICSPEEDYGSTPLNEALVVTTSILKDFQRKHNVDKMNLVVISDGDANSSHVHHSYRGNKEVQIKRVPTCYYGDAIIRVDGRQVRAARSRRAMTTALLKNLSKNYGANTLGFFIADGGYGWKNKLMDLYEREEGNYFYSHEGNEFRKDCNKEYRKNKCVVFNDAHGYNTYYLLKGGSNTLKTEGEEFAPEIGSTKGQLTSAFRTAAKSGKTNKVLLKNFGGAVA